MREDDEEFRHYVPLLRRIIILVTVITAVPVVLWTITAFVRTYVGPPKIPTFHQLASTASINAPAGTATPDGTAQLQAAMQAKLTNQSAATASDARDPSAAPKGSLLGDRAPEGDANAATQGAPRTAEASAAQPMAQRSAMAPRGADVFPPSPLAAPDNATPGSIGALAAAQPAAMDPAADALPASPPLSRPVPLPRHRPREAGMVRTADIAPSNVAPSNAAPSHVPMPRPRPDAAGAGATPETTGASPIGFIQNLFH
jgi:hypothetical protein